MSYPAFPICVSGLKPSGAYDEEFMEACRGELSFEPRDWALTPIAVAEHNGKPIGVAR